MADSAIVGRFVSERALAAVGASYALTNIFICVAVGGGIGSSVIVSRHFGEKNYRNMKISVSTAMISFLFISIILGGIGSIFCRPIMILLNTPDDTLGMAVVYLKIYFLGLPFLFMYNVISSMFNALGKSKTPLIFLIFSSMLNVALDLFMVSTLDMGVAGAAWATLVSQGIAAVSSFCIEKVFNTVCVGEKQSIFKSRTFQHAENRRTVYSSAVYSFYRDDACSICYQQFRCRCACGFFFCHAYRIYLCSADGRHRKRRIFFYRSEYRCRKRSESYTDIMQRISWLAFAGRFYALCLNYLINGLLKYFWDQMDHLLLSIPVRTILFSWAGFIF